MFPVPKVVSIPVVFVLVICISAACLGGDTESGHSLSLKRGSQKDLSVLFNLLLQRSFFACAAAQEEARLLLARKNDWNTTAWGEQRQVREISLELTCVVDTSVDFLAEGGLPLRTRRSAYTDLVEWTEHPAAIGYMASYFPDGKTVKRFTRRPNGETIEFYANGQPKSFLVELGKGAEEERFYQVTWDDAGNQTDEKVVSWKSERVGHAQELRLKGERSIASLQDPSLGCVMQRQLARSLKSRMDAEMDVGYGIIETRGKLTKQPDGTWLGTYGTPKQLLRLVFRQRQGLPVIAEKRVFEDENLTRVSPACLGWKMEYDEEGRAVHFRRLPFGENLLLYPSGMVKRFTMPLNEKTEYVGQWDDAGALTHEGIRRRATSGVPEDAKEQE